MRIFQQTLRAVCSGLFALWLLPIVLFACTTESDIGKENHELPDGTEFEVSFGGYFGGMEVARLRSTEDNNPDQIASLRLLVFDQNRRFLYSRQAKLGSIVPDNKADADHLPDGQKDNITQMRGFTTTLISSSQKRYIHFIANHNWSDFPQDYLIQGVADGGLIGGLTTRSAEFWRMAEFERLQKSSLNGKVIKLLRNNAKISVSFTEESLSHFAYEGFTVYNAPDKGTVAPFVFNSTDLSYEFPHTPRVPTIPAAIETLTPPPFGTYTGGLDVFEQSNRTNPMVFVIIRGRLRENPTGYYKVDLAKFDPETGVTSLYDIVRNHFFRINVKHIANKGYPTPEEAANNPAGNNLFASVELADYPSVSDGESALEVEKQGKTFVSAPSVFSTLITYTEGVENVRLYLSWEPAADPYIGNISFRPQTEETSGKMSVEIKAVPDNHMLEYSISVVAIHPVSRNTITRKIRIFLHPPYEFNAQLFAEGTAAGGKATVTFNVPATISATSFPFDVFVETKELTPNSTPALNNGMLLVFRNGKYYYRYTVKDDSYAGKTISLNFIRNRNNGAETVKLTSDYYKPATLRLDGYFDELLVVTGRLTYGIQGDPGSVVPKNADLRIIYNGAEYPAPDNTAGIAAEMLDDNGNYRLMINQNRITDFSKELTIRYPRTINNAYGGVTHDNQTTQNLQQWIDTPNQLLARNASVVKGQISYNRDIDGYGYSLPSPASATSSIGTLTVSAANIPYYNPFTLTVPQEHAGNVSIRFTYPSGYYTYWQDYSLTDLENDSRVYLYNRQ